MNIKKLGTMVAAATVASLALAGVTATAANAADPLPLNYYFADGGDGHILADGQVMNWSDQVLGLPGPTAVDLDTPFTGSADATGAVNFISPVGQETTISAWLATGPQAFMPGTKDILQPNLSLSGFTNGNWAGVKAGGDYSIGFAWTINNGVGLATKGVLYRTIHVQSGGAGNWTFDTQASVQSPVITTTALDSATQGTAFSQTIAATGTAPITWSVTAGALPAGLSLAPATGVISGTPSASGAYSFTLTATNTAGNDTQAFTGSVAPIVPTAPTEPTGSAAGKVTVVDPALGADTIVVPTGIANAGHVFRAWAWSDPTDLGLQDPADASGNVTVDISGLPGGTHTIALTEPGDAAFTVLFWDDIVIQSVAGDPISDDVDLEATVSASDLWSLEAEETAVDFGSVARNTSSTKSLGKVTVVDDRNELKGWDLDAAWTAFTAGANSIPTSALTITPKEYTGYTLIPGITLGATANKIAQSTAVSTLPAGALFDADLTFTAPQDAAVGEYHSTLTLTLTSK
jgi:hypothetical protein